ncbi:Uncharacterised protein at_DN0752 [Pycnogonum litorale]
MALHVCHFIKDEIGSDSQKSIGSRWTVQGTARNRTSRPDRRSAQFEDPSKLPNTGMSYSRSHKIRISTQGPAQSEHGITRGTRNSDRIVRVPGDIPPDAAIPNTSQKTIVAHVFPVDDSPQSFRKQIGSF